MVEPLVINVRISFLVVDAHLTSTVIQFASDENEAESGSRALESLPEAKIEEKISNIGIPTWQA